VSLFIPCGDQQLEAEATLQPGAPGVVVCHPHPAFGGRMDTPLVVALYDAFAARGLSTLRFNFRGLERSTGKPTGGLLEWEDVRAAADWLRAQGSPQIALVGYSFGALMAIKAIAEGDPARSFAAVGFPTTIIGDNADRLADVERALAKGIASLFVQGDRDQFCELSRVREWATPTVEIQTLSGAGHFFSGPAEDDVVRRVDEFVAHSLALC
jgi:uncharacterized protein